MLKFWGKALEEAEEPEPEPDPEGKTMMFVELIEGFGVTQAGIKLFEDNDWKEEQATTTGQGIVRILPWLWGDSKRGEEVLCL